MKKLVLFSTIVFSLLFLAGCGNKKADVSDTTTVDATTTSDIAIEAGDASKDECLELMAYAFKVAVLQASGDIAGATAWAQKAGDLELKYRAAGREYEEACNEFLKDTSDMSFLNEVQKRVKELK